MKRRLLLILGGFAIGCVLTIFAQQTDSADPRIGQQRDLLGVPQALDEFGDINRALDDAYNRNDAAAAAALFTEDAVLLAPDGMFSGRQHSPSFSNSVWIVNFASERRESKAVPAKSRKLWCDASKTKLTGPLFNSPIRKPTPPTAADHP